jgi:hypothetical protein
MESHNVTFMDGTPLLTAPLSDNSKDDLLPPPYQPTQTPLVSDKSLTASADETLDFSLMGGTAAYDDGLQIDHLFPDKECVGLSSPINHTGTLSDRDLPPTMAELPSSAPATSITPPVPTLASYPAETMTTPATAVTTLSVNTPVPHLV